MKIVLHSFEGRYSDNPRVLYEELARRGGHELVWLVDPAHRHGFPDGIVGVEYGGPESIAALESADLVIANTHTDLAWTKRPDAIYLQTWHGTPLKRIHWDVLWAPEGRLERLQRDVDQWDYLVSPNRASTAPLRGAFRFEGEVMESGYPRNDVLSRPEAAGIRSRTRAELGIADGKRAILYTPTWRDEVVFDETGDHPFALDLDVDGFAERFGDDHVLLLRLHYMLTGRLEASKHPSVIDVSFHPQVSDLYLAADAMVTDYSSTMFDFGVTGKPMLFYTYDLEDYQGRQRGFYFDFEPLAPGPLLETNEALFDAIARLDAVTASYAERYAAFRERFCHLEDGRATERVLDAVLPPVAA